MNAHKEVTEALDYPILEESVSISVSFSIMTAYPRSFLRLNLLKESLDRQP